jgi:hypothetical protein
METLLTINMVMCLLWSIHTLLDVGDPVTTLTSFSNAQEIQEYALMEWINLLW